MHRNWLKTWPPNRQVNQTNDATTTVIWDHQHHYYGDNYRYDYNHYSHYCHWQHLFSGCRGDWLIGWLMMAQTRHIVVVFWPKSSEKTDEKWLKSGKRRIDTEWQSGQLLVLLRLVKILKFAWADSFIIPF